MVGDNQYVAPTAVPTRPPVDDPVLFWLPEILAAEETGIPPPYRGHDPG